MDTIPNINSMDLNQISIALGLDVDANRDDILQAIVEFRASELGIDVDNLDQLEEYFKPVAQEFYGLDVDSSWSQITDAYLTSFFSRINNIPEAQKKEAVLNELRRLELSKFIQSNKFTTSTASLLQQLKDFGALRET